MSFQHRFPEEIQSWIIGKRIPQDHETLGHCKIKGSGHTAYLYLRSTKSVGLTREAYEKRWNEQYAAGTIMFINTNYLVKCCQRILQYLKDFSSYFIYSFTICQGECGGLMVEPRTLEREVGVLIPTSAVSCP